MDMINLNAENGISIASFKEIQAELQTRIRAIFEDIDLSPSSPDGLLIDLFAFAYTALAENLQFVVSNMNVSTSTGIFLDYLASITVGGRHEGETDEELRKRIANAEHYGYATFNGMLTYLRAKIHPAINLISNDSSTEENGIPAHSFKVYVPLEAKEKMTNNDIASALWECKPVGIDSVGNESGKVKDASGAEHIVCFEFITPQEFKARITITEYNEETLPEDYVAKIQKSVSEWAKNEYTPGKDVIPQRLIVPVFTIEGILSVDVQISINGTTWTSDVYSVGNETVMSLPAENIEVILEGN